MLCATTRFDVARLVGETARVHLWNLAGVGNVHSLLGRDSQMSCEPGTCTRWQTQGKAKVWLTGLNWPQLLQ